MLYRYFKIILKAFYILYRKCVKYANIYWLTTPFPDLSGSAAKVYVPTDRHHKEAAETCRGKTGSVDRFGTAVAPFIVVYHLVPSVRFSVFVVRSTGGRTR